jgi:hypothetical protein
VTVSIVGRPGDYIHSFSLSNASTRKFSRKIITRDIGDGVSLLQMAESEHIT